MASEVKDCEEETLQTAFKKLRVDAESPRAAARICEALAQKPEGGKSKGACPKENWHGCVRKTSRGAVRSQRRRRSKSPILHPPKFTYCSPKMSPPPGHRKHKSVGGEGEAPGAGLGVPAKKELLSSGHASPVFGAPGYEPRARQLRGGAGSPEGGLLLLPRPPSGDDDDGAGAESPARVAGGAGLPILRLPPSDRPAAGGGGASASHADFRSLSRLQERRAEGCDCEGEGAGSSPCRRCGGWEGVAAYSFTGLRDVISECEREPVAPDDPARASTRRRRTLSGSPRSCSEQARAYVDDITIEDLSGYMEYYLYIPKKMSHMAEMMYT